MMRDTQAVAARAPFVLHCAGSAGGQREDAQALAATEPVPRELSLPGVKAGSKLGRRRMSRIYTAQLAQHLSSAGGEAHRGPATAETFDFDQVLVLQREQVGAARFDRVRRTLHQKQRGNFVMTQHSVLHCDEPEYVPSQAS
jgi:hypothetical protein